MCGSVPLWVVDSQKEDAAQRGRGEGWWEGYALGADLCNVEGRLLDVDAASWGSVVAANGRWMAGEEGRLKGAGCSGGIANGSQNKGPTVCNGQELLLLLCVRWVKCQCQSSERGRRGFATASALLGRADDDGGVDGAAGAGRGKRVKGKKSQDDDGDNEDGGRRPGNRILLVAARDEREARKPEGGQTDRGATVVSWACQAGGVGGRKRALFGRKVGRTLRLTDSVDSAQHTDWQMAGRAPREERGRGSQPHTTVWCEKSELRLGVAAGRGKRALEQNKMPRLHEDAWRCRAAVAAVAAVAAAANYALFPNSQSTLYHGFENVKGQPSVPY